MPTFCAEALLTRRTAAPSYGAVLLPVGLTRESDALVRSMADLANRLGAQLMGVSCPSHAYCSCEGAVERDAVQRLAEAAGERFADLSESVRAGRTWRCADGPATAALAGLAWATDLIAVNASELAPEASIASALRRLLDVCGAPTLVRPREYGAVTLDRVAVVCDSSPACRRALRGAMPVIMRSRAVTILAADASGDALWRGLMMRGAPEPKVSILRPATPARVTELVAGLDVDLVILGGWSELFGGWPGRSFVERLLVRGRTALLLAP